MYSLTRFSMKLVAKALVTISMSMVYMLIVNNNNIHSVMAFTTHAMNKSIKKISNRNVERNKLKVEWISLPSARSSGQSCCGVLKSKKSDYEYDDNERDNDDIKQKNKQQKNTDIDIDKPIYRSKLQKLNQVQNKKNMKTEKRSKLNKSRTSSSMKQFDSFSTTNSNNDDNTNEYNNDNNNNKRSISSLPMRRLLGDITIDEEYGIDSFLRGEYDRPFAEDAAAPLPNHSPSEIVDIALHALRNLNDPTTDHGAAVFMRFCAPLSRQDRWGNSSFGSDGSSGNMGSGSLWKAIMRGSLTPTMLARRIRASDDFSVLLDWNQLDVTKGTKAMPNEILGYDSTVAFVNAALFFGNGVEPSICQFTLKMFNGVWLIDSAVMNKRELFMDKNDDGDYNN